MKIADTAPAFSGRFAGSGRSDVGFPRFLTGLLLGWIDRARQRRALSQLDSQLLKDIGLNPYDARREIDKPFWQA